MAITVTDDGRILPGEAETPLLPLMSEIGRRLGPGTHRVNPGAFVADKEISPTLRYCGELFKVMLERQGIRVSGRIIAAAAPAGVQPLYTHTSPQTVADLVRACLHYSNNYIANQLFLDLRRPHARPAGNLGQGAAGAAGLHRHDLAAAPPGHHDGRGVGVVASHPDHPGGDAGGAGQFQAVRHLLKSKDGIPLKTGSLSGVHCYAGYFRRGTRSRPLRHPPQPARQQPRSAPFPAAETAFRPSLSRCQKIPKKSSFVAGGFEEKKIMED